MTRMGRLTQAQFDVRAQREWIEEHGGDLVGYRMRYFSDAADADAVYEADMAKLRRLEEIRDQLARDVRFAQRPR